MKNNVAEENDAAQIIKKKKSSRFSMPIDQVLVCFDVYQN